MVSKDGSLRNDIKEKGYRRRLYTVFNPTCSCAHKKRDHYKIVWCPTEYSEFVSYTCQEDCECSGFAKSNLPTLDYEEAKLDKIINDHDRECR